MKAFTGKARLHIDDHVAHISISLNPQAGVFEAELLTEALPEELFSCVAGPARVVRLSDIEIPLPTGVLQCTELNDVYLGVGRVSMNISETPVSKALNLAEDRSGIREITLSPCSATIQFSHNPPLEEVSELYFLNNFVKGIPSSIGVNGTQVNFHQRQRSLSVTSPSDLRPFLSRIAAAWAILQGAHLTHAATYNADGSIDLAVRRPRAYNKGTSLFRGWNNQETLLSALVASFVEKSDEDFQGWEKAISFYLEGRNSELDYDVRIIGFMVFIEMFDGSRTMSRQAIAQEFSCSLELADFLVRMRNKLIHDRMSLWTAVPQVHSELLQYQPGWVCPEIGFAHNQHENCSILFFLHLERLVNNFIASHIGYTGPFDNNSELIAQIESKMVGQSGVPAP